MSTATLEPAAAAAPVSLAPGQALNINEASKVCGLSPSVLRIWELRYGWPSPRRRANGYRAYSAHQVQELQRVATLVKSGTPISQLIVDGLPRFPTDGSRPQPPRGLPKTKSLPRSRDARVAQFQDEVIAALDTRNVAVVQERIQRAVWQLRPSDEPAAVLVPVLVGIHEARANGRPMEREADLLTAVRTRTQQLSRMLRQGADAIRVVPLGDDASHVLAQLVALVLNQRCQLAVFSAERPAKGRWIAAGDGDAAGAAGHVTALGGDGQTALAELLEASKLLPWSK